jgi:hypothetical protein
LANRQERQKNNNQNHTYCNCSIRVIPTKILIPVAFGFRKTQPTPLSQLSGCQYGVQPSKEPRNNFEL